MSSLSDVTFLELLFRNQQVSGSNPLVGSRNALVTQDISACAPRSADVATEHFVTVLSPAAMKMRSRANL